MSKLKIYFCLLFLSGLSITYAQKSTWVKDTLNETDSIRNIELHEVKVIAHENRSVATSSVIGQEAIRHIQSFSLTDLMQLLPGGTTTKVSFKYPLYFTIRHIGTDLITNSLGTGINIDGVKISTNSDLQQPLNQATIASSFGSPNAQYGADTRELSTDNIKSVEVIRGIPSVRYGDITSGMVIIHTRKDARPYSASIRLTPEIKSFNAGKGWQIRQNETLNLAAGYLHSNSDISSIENIYHRISAQTGYTGHFNLRQRPLNIEAGGSGDITINHNPLNTLLQAREYIKAARQSFRFNFSGEWIPDYLLLTNIQWKTSVAYAHSISEYNRYISGGYTVGSDATENKEQEGFFIPPQYWQHNRIESCPIDAMTGLTFSLRKSVKNWKIQTILGVEWNCEGNKGDGKTYNIHTPSLPSQPNYNFRNIPFIHHYAAYIEENLQKGNLTLEGGIRITGTSIRGKKIHPVAEPRLNLNYLVLQRPDNEGLRLLRIRGGIGLLRKMPTFSYLFGEPQYTNITNYRYRDDENGQSLAVITTIVSSLSGTETLKLPQNFKAEIGFSGIAGNFSFDITGFYEHLEKGFKQNSIINPVSYRNYNNDNKKGQQPEYRDGEVYVDGKPTGYTNDTTFRNSNHISNDLYERKGGIEFTLRSDYIPALASTFILDGAWILRHATDKSLTPVYQNQMTGMRSYPMCGIYDNGARVKIWQQFNTTLRTVTEIPSIRLITTIALQAIWLEHSQIRPTRNTPAPYYMKDAEGNRITEHLTKDEENTKYLDPIYYMDSQGSIHHFTPELANNPEYSKMVDKIPSRYFLRNSYSPYFMLNLRVSKNIGEHISISFFANNLAKMNPRKYYASSGQYQQMNPPAFFGTELQIRL